MALLTQKGYSMAFKVRKIRDDKKAQENY